MIMTDACNLEALPKDPQFRVQMKDFPEESLADLHLFRGQKLEDLAKAFFPEDVDLASLRAEFVREVADRQGETQQTLMEAQGPVTCLHLAEENMGK